MFSFQNDKMLVARARKIQRFLSQPFHVAEQFTGLPLKIPGSIIAVSGIWCFKTPISPSVVLTSIISAFPSKKIR